jgi:hypothetical protein
MFSNIEAIIKAKELQLQGINTLLESLAIQESVPPMERFAGVLKSLLDSSEEGSAGNSVAKEEFLKVFESMHGMVDKPDAIEGLKRDIKFLENDDSNVHRPVIAYLKKFLNLLEQMPSEVNSLYNWLTNIGVPVSGGKEVDPARIGYMLDHLMDEFSSSTESSSGKVDASTWTDGRGKAEYAPRIHQAIEFVMKEQHKVASRS